jgi:hypothetical protein
MALYGESNFHRQVAASSSHTLLEYLILLEECACIAEHIHPLYQTQNGDVAAMMSIPLGMNA